MDNSRRLGWFALLFMVAVTACSTTVPPHELMERSDHGGLAIWYEQEVVRLRGKVEEMRQMAERYAVFSYPLSPKETRRELIAHCRYFMDYYAKAAEEAEALAKLHHEQDKAIP